MQHILLLIIYIKLIISSSYKVRFSASILKLKCLCKENRKLRTLLSFEQL